MLKRIALNTALISSALISSQAFADAAPAVDHSKLKVIESSTSTKQSTFKSFTGKIIGNNVRMRVNPDLDSHIISELVKDDYVVVKDQTQDFYAVEAPKGLKAFIFRGFVIDKIVEGERVNIRLAPDRESPIVGHFSTGQPVDGKICENNTKWLEINMPEETQFYIAKEYVEYAGNPDLKAVQDSRREAVIKLINSTNLLSQGEMRKAFNEIDMDRITQSYQTIIRDYADFPRYVEQAKKNMTKIHEEYLHRKISFLESKTSKLSGTSDSKSIYSDDSNTENACSPTDRMKVWEPVEEAVFLSWSALHHAKSMEDFYKDQKLCCQTISGILENFSSPVKNKPGDFILKDQEIPVGFVYSTHINLSELVGKRVNLLVSSRPSNNFAFPAYFVLGVE